MDRNEMTIAIAAALIGAFLLGWATRWLFGRMNASGPRNAARTADMATRLHAAEDARHRAEHRLAAVEAEATRRVQELRAEAEGARGALAQSEAQVEEVRAAYRRVLLEREG
jgi:hypothetical protein